MQVTSNIGIPPVIICESNKEISPPSKEFFDRILAVVLNCFAWIKNFCFTYPTLIMSVVDVVLCASVMILRKQTTIEIFSALFKIILSPVFKTFLKMGATSQVREKKVEEYEEGIEVSFNNNQIEIKANFFIHPTTTAAKISCFLKGVTATIYQEYRHNREISANKKVNEEGVVSLTPKQKLITRAGDNYEHPFLKIEVIKSFSGHLPLQEFLDPFMKNIQDSALASFNNYKDNVKQLFYPH